MNWDEITRSDQYQQADDYNREVMRNNFIQQTVHQYGWNEEQASQFRAEFDRHTAPRGNVYSGELNDAWNSLRSGAASATADMAQFFTGGTPNAVSRGIRDYADEWAMDRSPSTIEAVENFGFGEDQEITGRGFAYGALSGLGSMAPMMAGGGLLGKGIQYGGKALSGYGKARKALETADNVTDATRAATRLAKLDRNIDRASSTVGYGSVGGAMVGGGAGNQTWQEVMALDDQTLLKSKAFQNYYRQTYQETPDNKRQAFDKARAMLAEDLAAGATAKAAGIGAASMALLGPQLQKIVTGKGPQGILTGGAAGAGTEGIQETFEGGGQQWATNTELAAIDGRSQWQDVANVAATGAVLGMGSGGPMGAIGGAFSRGQQAPTQEQLSENFTANQRTMAAAEQEISQFDADIANANQTLGAKNEDIRFLEMQLQEPGADTEFLTGKLQEVTAERDAAAAIVEDRTSQRAGAINHIRESAIANARIQQQIKQAPSQPPTRPGQNETEQANWQSWSSDGVDYDRPAADRSNTRGEQFRAPRTNPFNDMGEQRIGREDGKPFKSMVELQDYAERMKLTRFPFMAQKVDGGYILVGMPDQVRQQAEHQGAITRADPQAQQQSDNFERVLEGQYIALSDIIRARQARQAAQPRLTQQPQEQGRPQAERELFPYRGAAQEFMQRNGIQGNPVQLDNGLWTIRPAQPALTDDRRTYVDSRGNVQEDYQQVLSRPAPDEQETPAAQNHPAYAYQGNDADYQLYSEKAAQLNKLMRKFQGDPRDRESFKELKQLIQDTKRLEKSAMEQAKARRKPIVTVNRVRLLQQARAALEGRRINEFNNLMADIRQTNLEEQRRLSGSEPANNNIYDNRLSNQQYREYLQTTAEEVQAQEQLERARAQAAKGKGGEVQPDDTLLTAIGRLGGLRTDSVEDTVAESIKYWVKSEGRGLSGRYLNRNGLTADDMGRILSDYGYYDQNGQEYGANSLTDAIVEEMAGRPRFSQAMGDYGQVAQQQGTRAASGASNVTAPAVRAALAGEPLSPAYRQEVSRILDEAESDPYFDRPEFLSQHAADIEQSRRDNAVTDDWYDNFEQVDIVYAEGRTGLDSDTFNEADWELVEAEARELSTLADAAANEQNNQVESDEADTYERTGARVRYGAGRGTPEATGQRAETEGTAAAEQRGTDPQEVSPSFNLTTQTEQELQQQAEQQKAAEADARKREEQARQKAAADKEADDFVLSGSSSASDQAAARGQADLLGAQPAPNQSPDLATFTMDLGKFFGVVTVRPSNPVSLNSNETLIDSKVFESKTKIRKSDQSTFDLPESINAWRVSIIKGENGNYSRVEKIGPGQGRNEQGEQLAQFDEIDSHAADALHRIAPKVQKEMLAMFDKAKGQADLLGANPAPSNNDQITEPSNNAGSASTDTETSGSDQISKPSESEPNPEPTEAQKQAGNYKKEHIKLQGLDISLENKRGSTRSGTDPDGNEWSVTMAHDYGYIKRTEGADGDQVDVFVGDNPDSEQIFIVDQVNKDGSFDEHKVMLGFTDRQSAIDGYKASYQKGWKVGEVTQLSMGDFKNWLKEGDTTKPASKQKTGESESSTNRYSLTNEKNLFVVHNLSAKGVIEADKLGGLAAPSIAVARSDVSSFDGFGEISLLAKPELLNDKKTRTFDADIYSPRQPRAHYDIDSKAFYQFVRSLDPDNLGLDTPDINQASDTDGANEFIRSDSVELAYLQEIGKVPAIKNARVDRAIRNAARGDIPSSPYEIERGDKFYGQAKKYYQRKLKDMYEKAPDRANRFEEIYFDDNAEVHDHQVRNFYHEVKKYKDSGGKDIRQFRNDISKKLRSPRARKDFEQWATDKFNSMVKGRKIFKGFTNSGSRRYSDYSLQNVVKEMTQQLQAGENFFYGAGTIRSAYAKEFKSIKDIQKDRNKIIPEAELEQIKEESGKVLEDALERLKPYYKYDADSWGYMNDAGSAITEGRRAQADAFNLTPEARKIIDDLVEYLTALPTTYFEAKAQRAVSFSEFDTAIVPRGTDKKVLEILKNAGLKVKTYDQKKDGDRQRVIAAQNRLLFKQGRPATGINRDAADQVASTIGNQLGVTVNVATDENQLPSHIRSQMEVDGVSTIKGIFDRRTGQAWIVSANLNNQAEAIRTVLHEVAGHQALTQMLGSTMDSVMARIHNDMPAEIKARIEKDYASQLKGMDEQTRKAVIAEEYLAHLAETNPTSSTFKRFVAKVRRVLRKLFPSISWTNDDVVELLEAARKKLKDGGPQGPDSGNRYSGTKDHNSFQDREVVTVAGKELLQRHTRKALYQEARNYARRHFKNTTVFNKALNAEIKINWQGIKHSLKPPYYDDYRALVIPALDRLIKSGNNPVFEADKKGRKDLDGVYRLQAWAQIKGQLFDVELIVRAFESGNKSQYDLKVNKEGPAGISGTSNTSYEVIDVVLQPVAGPSLSIDQRKAVKLSEDNRSDGNTDHSTNRYSLAIAATQANLSDDVQGVINKVHGGRQQQVGIVDRVKGWIKDMELSSKGTWKTIGDKFYTGMIDQFDPIAKMEKGVNAGKLKEAKDSAYKATLRTKNLEGIMTAVLGKGTPQLKNGSVVVRDNSKGLLEIFEPLAKAGQLEVWETWAAAKRAQRLLNEGRENLFTQVDIDTINRHVNARPELKTQFEQAHKQYQAFNKQILDFAQESGLIDPDSRKLWETDDYLPFHRVNRLDDGKQSSLLRRKGLSNQQSGIKQLEGGVDQISPMEAIYRNTASLIDASMKNIAMQRISDVGVAAGAMEKTRGGIRLTMDQVKERLVDKGILDEKDTITPEQKKRWEALLIKFEDMGEGSVKVSRDGKTDVYHVKEGNEDLLETMQAMGPDTLHGILKVFAMPKRLLTSMVTADPGFMARNFVRDTLSTWMTVHPEVGGKTLHASMLEAVANVKKGLESDDHWALMMAGGGGGGFYEITPDNVRGKLTPGQYKAHHRRALDNIEQSWQWWQKQGSRFENANRLAVFNKAMEQGASIAEAAHQAQDVLNFTRRGKWQSMRILTEIIPFLNARMQGLDRLARGGIENPSAMLLRGSMYMAASIALWSLFADDERYKELPDHEKLTWHHFWDGEGNHYRIPKPFEMGAIFATMPEVFNNVAFNGEDGEWAGKMVGKMFTDVFAMGMPQFIAPALDVARNKNSFTDAPILSLGMQYQMPESQYTPWTSETTKALAEAMPDGAPEWMRSPKRLEYLLRGYFGTLGSYALMGADALAREARGAPQRPELSVRQWPVIGSFIRGNDEGATRYSTEMYDLLRESNSLAATIKNFTEQGRLEEAAELEREGSEALDSRIELNRYSRRISKLKKEVRKILDSRFMTAPVKKQRIDRLNSQINDLYQEAIREAGY